MTVKMRDRAVVLAAYVIMLLALGWPLVTFVRWMVG